MRIIHNNFRRMDTSGMARKEKGKGKLTKSVMFLFYLKRERAGINMEKCQYLLNQAKG